MDPGTPMLRATHHALRTSHFALRLMRRAQVSGHALVIGLLAVLFYAVLALLGQGFVGGVVLLVGALAVAQDVLQALAQEWRAGPWGLGRRYDPVGRHGVVVEGFDERGDGAVRVGGETWRARSPRRDLRPGDRVRITARDGLVLRVESSTGRVGA
jgi:membrane protein implicated in regulation of membrane protease activity